VVPAGIHFSSASALGPAPPWTEILMPRWASAPRRAVEVLFAPEPSVDLFSRRVLRLRRDDLGPLRELRAHRQAQESVAVIAGDHQRRGVCIGYLQSPGYRPPPRLVHELRLIAAHLRSAVRLRTFLASARAAGEEPAPDLVLDPDGRVHDARSIFERAAIGETVRRIERARGRLRFEDPDRALALWTELVNGGWSVVDHVEASGRRWVLVRRNPPGERDPSVLTAREREVASHAAMGESDKAIAYALRLTPSCVSTHLASVRRKLRLRSRGHLVAFFRGAQQGRGRRDA
jgi:DNA-binding CsgD family transcriptional regulator